MNTEVTGKRVSEIAGRVLAKTRREMLSGKNKLVVVVSDGEYITVCTVDDVEAMAASCLTQRENKPKIQPTRKVKAKAKK